MKVSILFNEVRRLLASCCMVVTSSLINGLEMYDLIRRTAPWVLGIDFNDGQVIIVHGK